MVKCQLRVQCCFSPLDPSASSVGRWAIKQVCPIWLKARSTASDKFSMTSDDVYYMLASNSLEPSK